jgi:nucleotide-binding universal stress UspA family protein
MLRPRRSTEAGHRRKFLVVIDDTPECSRAVLYAARRAERTDGALVMLYVIVPGEFQHWIGVENIMRAEAMEAAEEQMSRFADMARAIAVGRRWSSARARAPTITSADRGGRGHRHPRPPPAPKEAGPWSPPSPARPGLFRSITIVRQSRRGGHQVDRLRAYPVSEGVHVGAREADVAKLARKLLRSGLGTLRKAGRSQRPAAGPAATTATRLSANAAAMRNCRFA